MRVCAGECGRRPRIECAGGVHCGPRVARQRAVCFTPRMQHSPPGLAFVRPLLVVLAATLLSGAPAPRARAAVPAGIPIARLKTNVREIALSFDDGPQPGPVLDTLLAVLASRRAHATFFVIGRELAEH